jgi:hypothetical protein
LRTNNFYLSLPSKCALLLLPNCNGITPIIDTCCYSSFGKDGEMGIWGFGENREFL